MSEKRQLWLSQIEKVCTTTDLNYIDILVDQAAWQQPIVSSLQRMQPEIKWFSLFDDTPEEGLLEQAPLLMRVQLDIWQHKAWLSELMEHFSGTPRLLMLVSPLSFDLLCEHLKKISVAKWGEQFGLLRFYDTRVFPLLVTDVFNLEVNFVMSDFEISLDDNQFERIACMSDAENIASSERFRNNAFSKEHNFSHYYRVAVRITEQGFLGDIADFIEQHHLEC
ncbi:DUF4123 domain-containing protein [Obesumbacterium proteus]|uniref:DUF4123 domain-containing protein n=1 Tax=Obesumbacterium proteus TaxID=82983 RepID=UPI00242BF940|nr:DUF4123 domain-containing protein [Obesumbacterium proteus]